MRLDLPKRVVLSPREMQKKRQQRWNAGERTCHICGEFILNWYNYVLDHVIPRGLGGGSRDDSDKNLKPAHGFPCNMEKGSKRL